MTGGGDVKRWGGVALAVIVLGGGTTVAPHATGRAGTTKGTRSTAHASGTHGLAGHGPAAGRVIAEGLRWRGVRYVFGGDSHTGIDCSAFTRRAYRAAGVQLPRVSADQARRGRAVRNLRQARPADLLPWDNGPRNAGADHVGIYLGRGRGSRARGLCWRPNGSLIAAALMVRRSGELGIFARGGVRSPVLGQCGESPVAGLLVNSRDVSAERRAGAGAAPGGKRDDEEETACRRVRVVGGAFDAAESGAMSQPNAEFADTLTPASSEDGERFGYGPFAHLTAPNAELYRQVMGAFLAAKRQFTVHLRPEDVHAALAPERRPPLEAVAGALESLERWGNLRADPDTSRVTAVEDFYRRRLIYQLTHAGEAAEEALAAYDEALGRRGELQAVALADIATQLRALLAAADAEDPDPAVVHLTLLGLVDRFTGLAANARAFMGSLQRTIELHDADVEVFLAYKDRLIDYLKRFIEDLVTRGAEIAELLGEVAEHGRLHRLLHAVAVREAADAAPDTADDAYQQSLARWRERFRGLRAWFLSESGRDAQAKLLRAAARHAIPDLLSVVGTLNERRSGRSDRSADFRALAVWFAQVPDDDARHRLWRSAFGLHGARHLTIDAETLAGYEDDPVPASTSWEDARSVSISAQLRRTGSYERRGKARAVADRGEAKRALADLARKQAEQVAAARARLATAGPIHLSDLGELDPDAFRLFLQMLGDALATLRPGVERLTATTNDGTMEIRMTRLTDPRTIDIYTLDGVLRGPDHLVEIVDLTAAECVEVPA